MMKEYILDLLDILTSNGSFSNIEGDAALKGRYEEGEYDRLTIITGQNAEGKSYMERLIAAYLNREGIEVAELSMTKRACGYYHMLYGSEDWETTGEISARSIATTFKGANKAAKEKEKKYFIILDEPEIGLSDEYKTALGKYIRQSLDTGLENVQGIVLVTHSKDILKELHDLKPHHIRMGDNKTLEDVIFGKRDEKSIQDLLDLSKKSKDKFRKINRHLEELKKTKDN